MGFDAFVILLGLGLLYWWAKDRIKDIEKKQAEKEAHCPHKPEWQKTVRVNNILSINPVLVNKIIPGRRWLTKVCSGCGRQVKLYGGSLQPWEQFKAEYDQESIDREAQYKARLKYHEAEKAMKRKK